MVYWDIAHSKYAFSGKYKNIWWIKCDLSEIIIQFFIFFNNHHFENGVYEVTYSLLFIDNILGLGDETMMCAVCLSVFLS